MLTTLRITHGVEQRRILAQADQRGRFRDGQVLGFLVEIGVCCRLNADSIMKEIKIVKIQSQDFLLGIGSLQLDGYHPLYRFLQKPLLHAAGSRGIELLGQLLGDGAAPPCAGLPQDSTLDEGTSERDEINSGVFVDALVLGRDQSLDQVWGNLVVRNRDPVLLIQIPSADHLSVA